jgi:hypothetical protein
MRRFTITHGISPTLIEECRKFCTRLAREIDGKRNSSFLAVQLLNDSKNWKKAYTINTSGGTGVILPVQDERSQVLPATDGFPLQGFDRNIFISRDLAGKFHVEPVILLPDNFRGLTGNLLTDHWLMNSLTRPLCAAPIAEFGEEKSAPIPAEIPFNKPDHVLRVNTGKDKIARIKDYLKCFDNNPSSDHSYELMVCVAQPEPGTRKPWGMGDRGSGNPIDVGHTFLVATEKTPDKTVVRNVGFYPDSFVWPYGLAAQGMLNNDSYHDFNIALSITTTADVFTQVLSFLPRGNDKGYQYNLNSNNCTSFVLNALREGNIILPRTIGTWKHGSGLNPGDLGEDIRTLPLSSNMKLITGYHSHPNQWNCV